MSRPVLFPLALVLALAPVFASPAAEADKTPPVFGSEVSLVTLPVFVSDPQGRAWRGLTVEDFELYADGKRVPTVAFHYVDTTSDEEQELIRQAPAAARRRFLLLFDLSFTRPAGLHRARTAARDFVRRRLAASDLAAVATVDVSRGVRLVANFTEDRGLLLQAVDTLGLAAAGRAVDALGLALDRMATDVQASGRENTTSDEIQAALRFLARQVQAAEERVYRQEVVTVLGSLQALGRALRVVEGRKQVLYFSAGFDSKALSGVSGSEMRLDSEAIAEGRLWEVDGQTRYGDSRLRSFYADVTRTLLTADCVVHSVDVTGLAADDGLTREEFQADTLPNHSGRESLGFMAAETGGRFFKDANDLSTALGEVADMTSRFYVLGYQPTDLAGPGRYHKLKVKVLRKGARVSHRIGYYERLPLPAQTALQRKFETAQLVVTGFGPRDLHFSALSLPFPAPGDRQALGVVLQVPKAELRWKGEVTLEVYGYAVAADGTVHDHIGQLARIDTAQADPKGSSEGVSFYGTLQVPPGKYTLKFLIQEPETGAAGVRFLDVTVPPHDPRLGFLLPPVMVDEPGRWLGLQLGTAKGERAEFPFTVAGQPFQPRTSFEVRGGATEKLVLISWEPPRPSEGAPALEIQSSLTDASGRQVPAGLMRIDKVNREPGGRRSYVLGFTPDPLAPGDYTLRIGVGQGGSRLESYALMRVPAGTPP